MGSLDEQDKSRNWLSVRKHSFKKSTKENPKNKGPGEQQKTASLWGEHVTREPKHNQRYHHTLGGDN